MGAKRAGPTSFGQIAGNPINRNGSIGCPDKAIRQKARETWGQRIYRLEQIADGDDPRAAIAAMAELRAVGFAAQVESTVKTLPADERERRVLTLLQDAKQRKASA